MWLRSRVISHCKAAGGFQAGVSGLGSQETTGLRGSIPELARVVGLQKGFEAGILYLLPFQGFEETTGLRCSVPELARFLWLRLGWERQLLHLRQFQGSEETTGLRGSVQELARVVGF